MYPHQCPLAPHDLLGSGPHCCAFAACRASTGASPACMDEAKAMQDWRAEREILATQIFMFCAGDAEVWGVSQPSGVSMRVFGSMLR